MIITVIACVLELILKMSLKIYRHIVPTNWMRCPQTARLFSALQGNIPQDEPQALFVGGCVRNALLQRDVDDLDVATPLCPEDVTEILTAADIKVIPTGIKHGTVTAVMDARVFEITTLRHDVETDGRHAVVRYTDSWIEDACRRDFTMNTLLMDLVGNIYDPLECGLDDLDARRVVFVGKAEQRIAEDHLRILRFFRFSALYANDFDVDGLHACAQAADKITDLSKERITQEFFKIIASEKPQDVLAVMFAHNVLKLFEFSDYNADFLAQFCELQKRYNMVSLAPRLFVFVAMNFENIKAMEELILFPKVFLRDMRCIFDALSGDDLLCDSAVRESIYRFGRIPTAHALLIELAQERVMDYYAPRAFDLIQKWDIPIFPLSGNDLLVAGIEKGPELGQKLDALENYWIEQGFSPDRDALLEQLNSVPE
tara:strand:- start:30 stop:1316 length:1287 start_codon:yes stop_codon:yes gene_type:complete